MSEDRRSKCDFIIDNIDRVLTEPPTPIHDSLCEAVLAGRMTVEEADECLQAYLKAYYNAQEV